MRRERTNIKRGVIGSIVGIFLAFAWIVGFFAINAGVGYLSFEIFQWKPWRHDGNWQQRLILYQNIASVVYFDILPWVSFLIIRFAKLGSKTIETAVIFIAILFNSLSVLVLILRLVSG
jgi:hypothetical protein